MRTLGKKTRDTINRGFSEERGNIAVETVIIIPILIWAYLAMFTIFDTYRQYTTQQKAAYTVSDLISRQVEELDADFVDGSHELFQTLTRSAGETGLRVTIATYDDLDSEYKVIWSRTRGGMLGLQSEDVANWSDRLPEMPQDEQVIIVETTAGFDPVFNIGLDRQTIDNFVFARPRYTSQVCYASGIETICALPTAKVIEADPNSS